MPLAENSVDRREPGSNGTASSAQSSTISGHDRDTMVSSEHGHKTATVEPTDMEKSTQAGALAGPSPVELPEGGLRAWLSVFGAFLFLFHTFGWTNAWGVLQSYYATTKYPNQNSSSIAWVGSLQMFCIFAGGAVTGVLYDKGYFRSVLTFGSTLFIFSFFMTTICKEFWQTILAQGVGMGLGMACLFLPPIAVLSQYFARRRSLAMGIAVTGSSAGGIVFPIFLNNMLARHSFGSALRAPAYLCLGLIIIANICVSQNPNRPQRPANYVKPNPVDFFKEKRYCLAAAGAFFVSLGIFFPFFFLQVFVQSKGLPQNLSRYSLAILNAASIFGRTLPNALADRIGPMNTLVPMCLMSCVLVWAMFGASNVGGAIVFAILYGFASGAYVSLVTPVFASLANSPAEIGVRSGTAFIGVGIAALVGSPIAGQLLERTPSFVAPICFSGGTLAIGTTLFTLSRFAQAEAKGRARV